MTYRLTDLGKETHLVVSNHSGLSTITKLNKDEYVVNSSGEVKKFIHKDKRVENYSNLTKTFRSIEYLIKYNFQTPENVLWVTMTYRLENGKPMTDNNRLYHDFKIFNVGLTRYLKAHGMSDKWLYVVEPQGSGAWHIHMLLDIGKPSKPNHPFIPNKVIARLWGQGFTKTKTLRSKDNISAYLSAYLTNDGKGSKKGSRLHFYPKGMRIYRCSRNLSKPLQTRDMEVIQKKVGGLTPTSVTASNLLVYSSGAFIWFCSEHQKYSQVVPVVQTRLHKHYYISESANAELDRLRKLGVEYPPIVVKFLVESLGAKTV